MAGAKTTEPELLVVDASVLVELVVAGRHRAGAEALLDRLSDTHAPVLITAAHGLLEACSALRRLVRRGVIAPDAGTLAVEHLGELDIAVDATGLRLREVWRLRDHMSAYDAAYAAAAEAFDVPLLTVDERLRRACAAVGVRATDLVPD